LISLDLTKPEHDIVSLSGGYYFNFPRHLLLKS